MTMIASTVWARVTTNGFHRWPDPLPQVAYLGNTHRHLFGFKVTVGVSHDDRDVEFHMLQAEIRAWLESTYPHNGNGYEFGASSCEALARGLFAHLNTRFAVVAVEVDEDSENGSEVRSVG